MRQDIKGLGNHPDIDKLKEYVMDAPEGAWTGRLDAHAWGNSQNLFCYFTDTATGKKYRLSVFSRTKYAPKKEGLPLDEEPVGSVFAITTSKSKNGLPVLQSAIRL